MIQRRRIAVKTVRLTPKLKKQIRIAAFLLTPFISIFYLFSHLPIEDQFASWRAPVNQVNHDHWMVIFGDSTVTGAAANPAIQATWSSLGAAAHDLMFEAHKGLHREPALSEFVDPEHYGITEPLRPTRLLYSAAEEQARWLPLLNIAAKSALRLDQEEYSFGYLVGRRLGIEPTSIVVAGEDGAKLDRLPLQIARLAEVSAKTLPPLALVSFVANDLCDPRAFDQPLEDFTGAYRSTLRASLDAFKTIPPHANGTRVVVLAPLDLAYLLTSPALAAQKIQLDVHYLTCGDLRTGQVDGGFRTKWMERILNGECPSVLNRKVELATRVARLKELQGVQVRVLREELARRNQDASQGLDFVFAPSVREIEFQAGDLAADCFHPSSRGHARIANKLLVNELRL